MSGQRYDVLIVGGGIMGSSTAYNLIKAEPRLKLAVIERDPTYAFASSALSMANVRVQFSLRENIQISQFALEFLDAFEEEMTVEGDRPYISFHHEGNLFLYDQATRSVGQSGLKLQQSLRAPVEWLDRKSTRLNSSHRLTSRMPSSA
jgi:glycine/D-amino acid oxidase-like deaminating enzyme